MMIIGGILQLMCKAVGGIGYFVGGITTVKVTTADRYNFSSAAMAASTAMATATALSYGIGDKTYGITVAGWTGATEGTNDTNISEKRHYSSEAKTSGGSLTTARDRGGRVSNATKGVVMGGFITGSTTTNTTEKYTYSSDAVAGGGNLQTARYMTSTGHGSSSAGVGIILRGSGVTTTEKYAFSGDTTSFGTSWTTTTPRGFASFGNESFGYSCGGLNDSSVVLSTTVKYAYSGDTTSAGTSMTAGGARFSFDGTSNSIYGIVSGGAPTIPTVTANSDVFQFSTEANSAGTSLTQARYGVAASCSAAPHL